MGAGASSVTMRNKDVARIPSSVMLHVNFPAL